ncbi:MAG: hypothetical protein RW306_03725 [Geobacteraceae bacterium]|nr:hypothetical protein [Geobacteraceae bacterium]
MASASRPSMFSVAGGSASAARLAREGTPNCRNSSTTSTVSASAVSASGRLFSQRNSRPRDFPVPAARSSSARISMSSSSQSPPSGRRSVRRTEPTPGGIARSVAGKTRSTPSQLMVTFPPSSVSSALRRVETLPSKYATVADFIRLPVP